MTFCREYNRHYTTIQQTLYNNVLKCGQFPCSLVLYNEFLGLLLHMRSHTNVGHLKLNTASTDVADIIILTCVNMRQQDAYKWTKPKTGVTP
jgi:hypothetical protein